MPASGLSDGRRCAYGHRITAVCTLLYYGVRLKAVVLAITNKQQSSTDDTR